MSVFSLDQLATVVVNLGLTPLETHNLTRPQDKPQTKKTTYELRRGAYGD